jgi:flagellar hook protein FlgE
VQTFTFTNGISITMSTPAGDDVGAIAGNLNGKTITIANNPTGTMAFVAGKNIDSMARDQFGVPAYTTNTTITTTVGSGTRVNNLALNIDSTNMTAYTAAEQTYTSTTNGNPLSQLTGYSFDNKGNLVASYGDGTTMIKGQLAIASFNNTEGLIPVGLNSYQVSGTTGMTSGAAVYGTANSGNLGAVQGKAVESSNVDLTGELVKLMTLQRLYTANSQAVKIEAATLVDDAIRIGQ